MSQRKYNQKINDNLRQLIQSVVSYTTRKPSFIGMCNEYFRASRIQKENKLAPRIHETLDLITARLVDLIEGESRKESLSKTARILGTLFLLSPFEERHAPLVNKKFKPIYRAAVTLRFVDELIYEGKCQNEYMNKYWRGDDRYTHTKDRYRHQLMFIQPIIYSIFCEMAGFESPEAVLLLKGEDECKPSDEFRRLTEAERDKLKDISLAAGGELLDDLLACQRKKMLRQKINRKQVDDFCSFAKSVSHHTYESKKELGSAFKISQIYASIIMPSRRNIKREETVQAIRFISEHASRGELQKNVASHFVKMFGLFPQGFGVACITKQRFSGLAQEHYEMGIVNKLYPEDPTTPHCRLVTRNKEYDRGIKDLTVHRSHNLFFPATYKNLRSTSNSNMFSSGKHYTGNTVIQKKEYPKFWEPYSYYSEREVSIWNNISYNFENAASKDRSLKS